METWAAPVLALLAAAAGFSLSVAVGRGLLARRLAHQRMARFMDLTESDTPGDSPGPADGPLQRLAAIFGTPSAAIVLLGLATVGALLSLLAAWTPGLLVAGALVALGGVLALRGENRRERLEEQLVPALQMMAAAMESGYSVQQALERVVRDSPDPIAAEFAEVQRGLELGTSLEVALDRLATRVGGENFEFFATIVAMQYRIGGDLPSLLASLASGVQDRLGLKAEVGALTAQARYSGWVLTFLPFGVIGLLVLASPSYMAPLVQTTTGRSMLIFATVLLVAGLASIRAISRVEV